jgi:hypothetical protein
MVCTNVLQVLRTLLCIVVCMVRARFGNYGWNGIYIYHLSYTPAPIKRLFIESVQTLDPRITTQTPVGMT